jgi:hypothetical protein
MTAGPGPYPQIEGPTREVIDIGELRQIDDGVQEFKEFLRSGPDFEDLEMTRQPDLPREIDRAEGDASQ